MAACSQPRAGSRGLESPGSSPSSPRADLARPDAFDCNGSPGKAVAAAAASRRRCVCLVARPFRRIALDQLATKELIVARSANCSAITVKAACRDPESVSEATSIATAASCLPPVSTATGSDMDTFGATSNRVVTDSSSSSSSLSPTMREAVARTRYRLATLPVVASRPWCRDCRAAASVSRSRAIDTRQCPLKLQLAEWRWSLGRVRSVAKPVNKQALSASIALPPPRHNSFPSRGALERNVCVSVWVGRKESIVR